jgi:hypothetical protein
MHLDRWRAAQRQQRLQQQRSTVQRPQHQLLPMQQPPPGPTLLLPHQVCVVQWLHACLCATQCAAAALTPRPTTHDATGEWEGVTASFTPDGSPQQLPEHYVPGDFREWGVELWDWQSQCSSFADAAEEQQYRCG